MDYVSRQVAGMLGRSEAQLRRLYWNSVGVMAVGLGIIGWGAFANDGVMGALGALMAAAALALNVRVEIYVLAKRIAERDHA